MTNALRWILSIGLLIASLAATGHAQQILNGHDHWVTSVVWLEDGKQLLSGSRDSTAILWDVETRKPLHTFRAVGGVVWQVAVAPDEKTFAMTCADVAMLWSLETREELRRIGLKGAYTVTFSPDGRTLAASGHQLGDKLVHLFDVETGRELAAFEGHSSYVAALVFTPDGKRLASAGTDGLVKLWSMKTHKEIGSIEAEKFGLKGLAFTSDGGRMATCGTEWRARMWSMSKGKRLGEFGHKGMVDGLAISPDDKTLATASEDNGVTRIRLFDLKSGKLRDTLEAGGQTVRSLAFSPDGRTLAAGSYDKRILLFEMGR